ncbi:hypothetical protein [Nocardia sp. NPDC049149]|uniref:hypothetical protein n=1 Tax=Nocardia sp. NPDC049149 TaxID=3364315 RepID=UPI0037106611
MIDDQPTFYTVDRVRKMKDDHEHWAAAKFGSCEEEGISSAGSNTSVDTIVPEVLSHVPRTENDINHVIAFRPWLWEYFLLAGYLNIGVRDIKSRRTSSRQPRRTVIENSGEALSWARMLYDEYNQITHNLNLALDQSFHVQAFGRQGNPPGDFRLIGEIARRVLAVYEQLLEWCDSAKYVTAPRRLQRFVSCFARLPDKPVHSMEESIGRIISELQNLLDTGAAWSGKPIVIALKITIHLDEKVQDDIVRELERINHSR